MRDLAGVFAELDLLDAPEMRGDVDARIAVQQLPVDALPMSDASASRWRGPLIAVGTALAILIAFGAMAVLIPGEDASVEPAGQVTTSPTAASTVSSPTVALEAAIEPLEPVVVPIGKPEGLARFGNVLWVWDATGQVAGYREGIWSRLPSLPNPAVDVTGSTDGGVWAITANRCDPSEAAPAPMCEIDVWYLEGDRWQQPTDLQVLPGGLEDIEVDDIEVDAASGTVWLASSEGVLHRWDGTEMTIIVADSAPMHNDGIAVTRDGTVWASRFNPFFPNDVGLARCDTVASTWEPIRPLGDENRQAVMATTPSGDLWVWFSEAPLTLPPEGKALGYYDSDTGQWTTYVDGVPATPRAMAADDEGVWLTDSDGSGIWQFDGEQWTHHPLDGSSFEVLDISAVDGRIWLIRDHDHALYEIEP